MELHGHAAGVRPVAVIVASVLSVGVTFRNADTTNQEMIKGAVIVTAAVADFDRHLLRQRQVGIGRLHGPRARQLRIGQPQP